MEEIALPTPQEMIYTSIKTIMIYITLILSALLFCACQNTNIVYAQTVSWTGATNSDWNEPSNWGNSKAPSVNNYGSITSSVVIGDSNPEQYNVVYNGDFKINNLLNLGVSAPGQPDNGKASLTINGNASFLSMKIGNNTAGQLIVRPTTADSTVNIGSGLSAEYLWVGFAGNDKTAVQEKPECSVLDLSAVKTVNINVNRIAVAGRNDYSYTDMNNALSAYQFFEGANVKLGTNNTITGSILMMASSFGANLSGLQTTLEFGEGSNNLYLNHVTIGGMKAEAGDAFASTGHLASIRNGGTFNLSGQPIQNSDGSTTATKANLYIANNALVNTSNVSKSTLDLSNASAVNMELDKLVIGHRTSLFDTVASNQVEYRNANKLGGANGTLKLGDNAQVNVNSIELARMDIYYKQYYNSKKAAATIELGAQSKITANTFTSGNDTITKWQLRNDSDPTSVYYLNYAVDGSQSCSTLNFNNGGTIETKGAFNSFGRLEVNFNNGGTVRANSLKSVGEFIVTGNGATQGQINVTGVTAFVGSTAIKPNGELVPGTCKVVLNNAQLTTDTLRGAAGANASSVFSLTLANNSQLNANTFTTAGTSVITVGTEGDTSDNSAMNITHWISNEGPTTFVLNSGSITAGSIIVTVANGQTNPLFEFKGGKLVVDEFKVIDTGSVQAASSALLTAMSVEPVQKSIDSLQTLYQSGISTVLSPGDDGICGKTLITGNYVLDSGAIKLDIDTNGQDVLNIDGVVTLGGADASIIVNFMETAGSAALNTKTVLTLMAASEGDNPLENVTLNNTSSAKEDTILLFSADSIVFENGLTSDEWGKEHVQGLSGDYTYMVVYTDTLSDSLLNQGTMNAGGTLPTYSFIATLNAEEPTDPTVIAVPEPSAALLLLLGVAGLILALRKKNLK